jgi:hypothetical protein
MHVYRERNRLAGSLSKDDLQMAPGSWHMWEKQKDVMSTYDPGHFLLALSFTICCC